LQRQMWQSCGLGSVTGASCGEGVGGRVRLSQRQLWPVATTGIWHCSCGHAAARNCDCINTHGNASRLRLCMPKLWVQQGVSRLAPDMCTHLKQPAIDACICSLHHHMHMFNEALIDGMSLSPCSAADQTSPKHTYVN